MVEPAWSDGYVYLRRIPIELLSLRDDFAASHVSRHLGEPELLSLFQCSVLRNRSECIYAPLGLASKSALVTDPSYIISHDCRNGLRLELSDGGMDRLPVIDLHLAVRTFCTCSVKPYFADLSVISKQLGNLSDIELVISRGVSVALCIAVPRGDVHSEFESELGACLAHFSYHVALSVFPWRVLYRIFGSLCLP